MTSPVIRDLELRFTALEQLSNLYTKVLLQESPGVGVHLSCGGGGGYDPWTK